MSLHGGESVINWQGISVKKVVRQVCAGNLYTSTGKKLKKKWLQTTKYRKQRGGREKEAERRCTTEIGTETDGGNGMNGGRVQKMGGW